MQQDDVHPQGMHRLAQLVSQPGLQLSLVPAPFNQDAHVYIARRARLSVRL